MLQSSDLMFEAQQFVETFFIKNLPSHFVYHSYDHSKSVVEAIKIIGKHSGLNPKEMETCIVSGWFHDTGYTKTCDGHEAESARIAENFLKEKQYPEDRIKEVKATIMATKSPSVPKNEIERVICDADMHHVATKEYLERTELLRQELAVTSNHNFNTQDWISTNINFLKAHTFFTNYAQSYMTERKEKNLKKLRNRLKEVKENPKGVQEKMLMDKNNDLIFDKIYGAEIKEKRPDRGIETMFRTTSTNHLELSSMADNKSNIMISINSIIISIIVTMLVRRLDEFPHFYVPTILLTTTSLLTIIFAVLATRPNITAGTFTREDVEKKITNLLFFGNFYNMKMEDYEWGVREMMKDGDYLYGSMIRDNYFLGKVLGRKYKLLRISYTIFMFGLIIAVFGYAIAIIFFKPDNI